jgi:hypothetical protein
MLIERDYIHLKVCLVSLLIVSKKIKIIWDSGTSKEISSLKMTK